MKVELITKKTSRGFSTIDVLMAMAILAVSLTSIIPLTFGSQSLTVDSETNHAAILLAKKNIEFAKDQLKVDFEDINELTYGTDPFYGDQISFTDVSQCSKYIKSSVDWDNDTRNQSSYIGTLVTNPAEAKKVGGYCDPAPPSGTWNAPTSFNIFSSSDFDGQGTGVDVAYINGIRYAFLITDAGSSGDNFYVINASDPSAAFIVADTKIGNKGLNGITVVDDYAYLLYNNKENQLIVVNVSIPSAPDIIENGVNLGYTLPYVTPSENPIPTSIFYYDEKLYIGTEFLAFGDPGENEEFHIYNVSSPANPSWQSSIDIDRRVNSIAVRDNIAYLATGPGSSAPYTPLKVYDLSSETMIDEFTHSDDWNGKSLYLLGSKLFFGLERQSTGSDPEFYIFDVSNPADIDEIGSKVLDNFGPASSAAITGVVVQGNLAFLVTTDSNDERLYIIDISDPDLPRINTCDSSPIPQAGTGITFMDNYIFISVRSNEAFHIIYPSLVCS